MSVSSDKNLPALADAVYENLDLDGLSRRQRLFVLKWDGRRPSAVAEDAGYTDPDKAAYRLMSNPTILKNISLVNEALEKSMVVSKLEILNFWGQIMRGELNEEGFDAKDRFNASSKLATFHGLLSEKLIVEQNISSKHEHVISIQDFATPPSQRELDGNPSLRIEYQEMIKKQAEAAGLTVIPADQVIEADNDLPDDDILLF